MKTVNTLAEAKSIGIKLWEYLEQHPEKEKWEAIEYLCLQEMECQCPFCELYSDYPDCHNCPLVNCLVPGSPYYNWLEGKDKNDRELIVLSAHNMVELIKNIPDNTPIPQ